MSINHLIIQQPTSSIEVVASSIIDKLYELAQNPSLDVNSTLQGNLQVTHAYEDAVTYLLNKFPNLQINVTGGAYIRFVDAEALQVMMLHGASGSGPLGDGHGITTLNAQSIVQINDSLFRDNTALANFNELSKFTNAIVINNSAFYNCSNLTSVDLVNIQQLLQNAFYNCAKLANLGNTNSILTIGGAAFGYLAVPNASFPNCTSIGNSSFDHASIQSISLPKCITFGESCFNFCLSLTSATLSPSLTSLTQGVFRYCSALVSVNLTANLDYLGDQAFINCTALTSIGDISKVTYLGYQAFSYCSNLTGVIDISGCTSFGTYGRLFENCPKITGIVTPTSDNVFEMRESFFENCIALTSFTFPKNVSSGNKFLYMFINCTAMTTLTFWQTSTCKIIGQNFCNNCSSLTTLINFPQDITIIESGAFKGTKITSVSLGEGLTTLGYEAFAQTKLDTITLPSTLTTMGGSEFSDTVTPRWAKCLAVTPPTGCTQWSFKDGGTYPIYVPDASLATYKAASGWSNFTSRLKALSTWSTDFPNG